MHKFDETDCDFCGVDCDGETHLGKFALVDFCWYCLGYECLGDDSHPRELEASTRWIIDDWLAGHEVVASCLPGPDNAPYPTVEWDGFLDAFLSALPETDPPRDNSIDALLDWIWDRNHDRDVNAAIVTYCEESDSRWGRCRLR